MYKLCLVLVFSGVLQSVMAAPISFHDFFVEGSQVSVSADGSSVSMSEDSFEIKQRLVNDPFFGDPEVLLTGDGEVLQFDYEFVEPDANQDPNNDIFVVTVFDWVSQDPASGQFLSQLVVDQTQAGTFSLDLTSFFFDSIDSVGLIIDLESLVSDGDVGLDSTLTVSNLRIVQGITGPSPLPAPGTLALLIPLMWLMRRKSVNQR